MKCMPVMKNKIHGMTVRMPYSVYEQAKSIIEKERRNDGEVISLNELVVNALQAYIKLYRRKKIDASFAAMAEDADYQKEAKLLLEEFEHSDAEALNSNEMHLAGETIHEPTR